MTLLQIDSAGIQNAVQQTGQVVASLLPGDWQLLAPAFTSVLTLITAAIIRAVEKGRMKREQKNRMRELVQIYLSKDADALHDKINEIQKRDL